MTTTLPLAKTDVGNETPGEFGAHAREYASTMTNPIDRRYVIALADALDKANLHIEQLAESATALSRAKTQGGE